MLKTVQTVDEINYVSCCEVGVNGDTLLVRGPASQKAWSEGPLVRRPVDQNLFIGH